jgi:hypothetical protein
MAEDLPLAANVRIGHRERDAVVAALQEAAADGRLSMAELEDRLEAALQAKTYADLDPLVADLSVELPSRALNSAWSQAQRPPTAGYSREDPLRLDGGTGTEKRGGVWTVPPFMLITQGLGSVKLNCLEATPAAQLIEIEVIGGAGSIVLVLPDGWAVDADRLSKSLGSKSVKVPREPAPGKPLLVIYGAVGLGSFKVRPANRLDQRRIEKKHRALGR